MELTTLERKLPPLNHMLLKPLCGEIKKKEDGSYKREEITEWGYLNAIEKFEKGCEKSLIETFARLSIKAIVKTDRYSLPYNHEVKDYLNGESYLNGPYEFHRVAREFVLEVLKKDLYELRFYLFINVVIPEKPNLWTAWGKVEYSFRYHVKSKKETKYKNVKKITIGK